MKDSIGLMLLLQLALILLNAVFACAEIAVLSVNEAKLSVMAQSGNKKAKRLAGLTSQPARFLATIQVAITLSGFLGSAFAAENFSDSIVNWLVGLGVGIPVSTLDTISVVLITLILSYFTLVFGELVPKRIAMKKAEQLALGISGLIAFISRLFAPIVWFLSISTNAILRLFGIDPNEEEEALSEADIRLMVDASSQKGGIDNEEKEFIQNVFEFDDMTAEEISTHRTELELLWMEEPMDTWAATVNGSRHNYYPICQDSIDSVVGMLSAKDYFRLQDKSKENVLEKAVKRPYFVPETVKADVLFRNMKRSGEYIAVVLDEYGGMVGIVTINDLVEQLVGDIGDDGSGAAGEQNSVTRLEDGSWDLRGSVELECLEEATGLSLDKDGYDTLTGLVFDALGAVPPDGEQNINLRIQNMDITVKRVEEHQIARASLRLIAEEARTEE